MNNSPTIYDCYDWYFWTAGDVAHTWVYTIEFLRYWYPVFQKSERDQMAQFQQEFFNTIYCIYQTAIMPAYCIWDGTALAARQETFKKCAQMRKEHNSCSRFLLSEPCKPIDIYDYSFDLLGQHAIDWLVAIVICLCARFFCYGVVFLARFRYRNFRAAIGRHFVTNHENKLQ